MKLGVVLAALTISLWGSDTNVDFSVEKGTQAIYQSTKNPNVYVVATRIPGQNGNRFIMDGVSYLCSTDEDKKRAVCEKTSAYIPLDKGKISKVCIKSDDPSKKDECMALKKIFEIPLYSTVAVTSISGGENACYEVFTETITHDYEHGESLPKFSEYKKDMTNEIRNETKDGCWERSWEHYRQIDMIVGDIVIISDCYLEVGIRCTHANLINGKVLKIKDMIKDQAAFIEFLKRYLNKEIDKDTEDTSSYGFDFYFTPKSLEMDLGLGMSLSSYATISIEDAKKFLKDEIVKAAWGR